VACVSITLSAARFSRVLKPLGINAAVKALEDQTSETSAARRQLELALQQARFSAAHARRQYDAVDPANRLVAGELERRWNEALQVVRRMEGEIAALEAGRPAPLGEKERRHLLQLGADLEFAWSHPVATAATRKRILRAALHEIVVRIEGGFIQMVLHWQGGDHTALQLKINGAGKHRWTVPEDTLSLIRELARLMPDQQIARLLNRAGKPTGRGNGWTKARVCSFRSHHGIAVYRESEWAERGEITLEAAAQIIDVSVMTALCMIRHGIIKGRQLCRGAPWVIKAEDLAAYREQKASRHSLTSNLLSRAFNFNDIEGTHYGACPLGHEKLETTARYTRVATGMISKIESPLDGLSAPRRSSSDDLRQQSPAGSFVSGDERVRPSCSTIPTNGMGNIGRSWLTLANAPLTVTE
jgi:hypothetical protein